MSAAGEADGELEIEAYDPAVHISPYSLFRRLAAGEVVRLVDAREQSGGLSFRGAGAWSEGAAPAGGSPVVMFDDDGRRAGRLARQERRRGRRDVRALYGGLRLYDHAIDPLVVGDERYLTLTS